MQVRAWKDKVVIPTYEIGVPEKYPVFLEKRVYQGSSGVVYPHPVVESISNEKVDKEWNVIFAENDFIKIMVIPDLGGRIQMAYDKIKERHFIYYNQVIKPALVGLTGPWISGGIEFNWPQHHRPSTFQPIDSKIEENDDGSLTIWVSEMEKMFGLKGMAGFTLHPNKAYLEITGKIYNRTAFPQTFLWWANPAVKVNDHNQSIFPPDVNAVFDHGKRDVSTFPIAKGTYYKVDYSPGTDISKYKNIPVPTSFMAGASKYDFVGSYENDSKAGMLHVSDHHVSPGKKQWTWGHGDFGQAWDRNLTDDDGPYIEIMCGVYTDNQPDFTWIQPLEEKTFTQYFMPFHSLGSVKNASKDLVVNVSFDSGRVFLRIYATSSFDNLQVELYLNKVRVVNENFDVTPKNIYESKISHEAVSEDGVCFNVFSADGELMLTYQGEVIEEKPIPDPAESPDLPGEVEHIEDLFYIGQHLEQYRHATFRPEDYYEQALSRDPSDIRCNNAMGLILLRKGKFVQAEEYFLKAVGKATKRNPNPSTGLYHYNLGLSLMYQGRTDQACKQFNKSCWCADCKELGNFYLAAIFCQQGKYVEAIEKVDECLIKNSHNHNARHIKVHALCHLGRNSEALREIGDSLAMDPFNFSVLFEKYFISESDSDLTFISELMRMDTHNFLEVTKEFALLGDFKKSILVLEILRESSEGYPMIDYFLGYYYGLTGDMDRRSQLWSAAEGKSMDYCFPNSLEEVSVLREVIKQNPRSARALYYLGNYWYAKREHQEAANLWNKSIEIEDENAICHRNLALFYYNKAEDTLCAHGHLIKALELDSENSRLLMEVDQFYKKTNVSNSIRRSLLEEKWNLLEERDDLYLEYVTILNIAGENERALGHLLSRHFQPWEGGEGKVPAQYLIARIQLAKKHIIAGEYKTALSHLEGAKVYPLNLGEGKLHGARENDIHFWMGAAWEGIGDKEQALNCWKDGAKGNAEIGQAFFYNDQQPDKIFYQGLCLKKLGEGQLADEIFHDLINYGKEHLADKIVLDYFAISLPDLLIWEDDLDERNRINCLYLEGLGNIGLGKLEKAKTLLTQAIDADSYHLRAHLHLLLTEENQYRITHGLI